MRYPQNFSPTDLGKCLVCTGKKECYPNETWEEFKAKSKGKSRKDELAGVEKVIIARGLHVRPEVQLPQPQTSGSEVVVGLEVRAFYDLWSPAEFRSEHKCELEDLQLRPNATVTNQEGASEEVYVAHSGRPRQLVVHSFVGNKLFNETCSAPLRDGHAAEVFLKDCKDEVSERPFRSDVSNILLSKDLRERAEAHVQRLKDKEAESPASDASEDEDSADGQAKKKSFFATRVESRQAKGKKSQKLKPTKLKGKRNPAGAVDAKGLATSSAFSCETAVVSGAASVASTLAFDRPPATVALSSSLAGRVSVAVGSAALRNSGSVAAPSDAASVVGTDVGGKKYYFDFTEVLRGNVDRNALAGVSSTNVHIALGRDDTRKEEVYVRRTNIS